MQSQYHRGRRGDGECLVSSWHFVSHVLTLRPIYVEARVYPFERVTEQYTKDVSWCTFWSRRVPQTNLFVVPWWHFRDGPIAGRSTAPSPLSMDPSRSARPVTIVAWSALSSAR